MARRRGGCRPVLDDQFKSSPIVHGSGCASGEVTSMSSKADIAGGEDEVRDVGWCAAVVDESALLGSRFEMANAIRERVGSHVYGDLAPGVSDAIIAMCWAFDYNIEIENAAPHHVRVLPRFDYGNGQTEPPPVREVTDNIRILWHDLVAAVKHPAAKSQLHHILFECGGRERQLHGRAAVDAYLESVPMWNRVLDAVDALRYGERLANAIGDSDRADSCLEQLLAMVEAELSSVTSRGGVVLRPLVHVVRAPRCPDRVDVVLERAVDVLSDADLKDEALQLVQARCSDDTCRQGVWRRRVEVFASDAESHDSPIIRLALRQKALQLADQSGLPDLRERAASLLQQARNEDLGLIRFEATCAAYDEEAERARQAFIHGPTWRQALISFANAGPLSGDPQANRQALEHAYRHNPLRFLMPNKILGPDQLPILEAVSEAEIFEYLLVQHETDRVQTNVRPLATALHDIVAHHGLPPWEELVSFVSAWPSVSSATALTICKALQRFWAGDAEGATYTLVPRIEGHVRELILNTNRGLYKLQRSHSPGQFPGLGAMLNILPEQFAIDEARMRFLKVVLVEPAGFNLRNQLAHGTTFFNDPATASVAIHTALFLCTLNARPANTDAAECNPSGSGGG